MNRDNQFEKEEAAFTLAITKQYVARERGASRSSAAVWRVSPRDRTQAQNLLQFFSVFDTSTLLFCVVMWIVRLENADNLTVLCKHSFDQLGMTFGISNHR